MNSDDDTLAGGLPHSEIPGSPIARISPGLFAACHVLHRLSVPRHPPDALTSRLITGIPGATTVLQPQFRPEMPHHRRAQGQDPSSRRSSAAPVARRNIVAPDTTASHEDTSSDRSGASLARAALGRQRRWRYADRRSLAPPIGDRQSSASLKAGPCGPSLSASVTSQLSLFTLQSTPASQ
jgi:hypothetical protein